MYKIQEFKTFQKWSRLNELSTVDIAAAVNHYIIILSNQEIKCMMTTKRELEEQQFEEELRKASDNLNNLNSNDNPILCQKSPLRSLNVYQHHQQSPSRTFNPQQSPLLSPRKSPRKGSPRIKSLSSNSTFDGKSDISNGSSCENSNINSEEDFDIEEDENDDDNDRDDDEDENEDLFCRNCLRLMSHMRKSAVRWLYMEWYKKAVLGQHLPTVSLFIFLLDF